MKMFLFLSKMAVGSVADTDVWINTPFRVVITIALGMEAAETLNIDVNSPRYQHYHAIEENKMKRLTKLL